MRDKQFSQRVVAARLILPHGNSSYRRLVQKYAAYGSNLDPARMQAYCPHSPMVGTGWLKGWRLTFAGDGDAGPDGAIATVVESADDQVFVALYDIHSFDETALDEVEGVSAGAYRKLHVRVSALDGDHLAWLYVCTGYEGGLPASWYVTELAASAEKAGAPDDYVKLLRDRPARPTRR